ncbi:MAG: hypothetical protein QOK48_1333 [Blastocatellia bacterium]|jgi:hypothetical protein|nr:hypothetical protein [Blastocatellia bacterium]
MTPNILRVLGILLLISAAVFAILNLHRVANLGMPWIAPMLLVIGIGLTAAARRK